MDKLAGRHSPEMFFLFINHKMMIIYFILIFRFVTTLAYNIDLRGIYGILLFFVIISILDHE